MDRACAAQTFLRLVGAVIAVVLIAGGCGSDDPATVATTTEPASETEDSSTTSAPAGPTTAPPTSATTSIDDTTSTNDTTQATGTTSTLPGEPIFSFPADGDILAVMGVAHDDVLNVRVLPGIDAEVAATMAPTADDAVAAGRARKLPQTIWYELTVEGVTGWANSSYLGFMGATDDATSEFIGGGDPPEAASMEALGELVADWVAPDDPEPGLRIVQSGPASFGDLAEISYDVIGIGDDSVAGARLHVFASSTDSGGFVLRSIERTTFCWRGVSDELCV